jgi:hypothetical protein
MTWLTGTQTEVLAVSTAVGSSYNTFTSAQYIGIPSGAGYLPANTALASYGTGKSINVKAVGTISTTGTPTFTMAVTANTTQGSYNSGAILATTTTVTQGSGESAVPWELDVTFTCTATGSSGTWLSDGMWKIYPTGTTLIAARIANSTPNTPLTLNTQSAYYIELAGTWSASSSSNAVQVNKVIVTGLN